MEITDYIKIIQGRLSKFNLENAVNRIIGYILLFYTHTDLALYASAPEEQLYSLTEKFLERLSSLTRNNAASHMPSSYPNTDQISDMSLSRNDFLANVYNQSDLVSLERQMHSSDPVNAQLAGDFGSMGSLRTPSPVLDCSSRACYFFNRGSCIRGNHCRFSHGIVKDDDFLPESLDKLSVRMGGLLKEKNGIPGAISSFPVTYHEKCANYWKPVELIDGRQSRGQHSVVLAEEVPKYEQCDDTIFLTFPAESTFTDDDVTSYFKRFGPVREVRIPREDKRDFGFLSFYYPVSVMSILGRSSPAHYICGWVVLVKPYKRRQRTKIYDRNNSCSNSDINTVPTINEKSRLPDKQLLAEQYAFETEKERLMEMQLASKPETPCRYSRFGTEHPNFSEVPTINEKSRLPDKQLLAEQRAFETDRERLMGMQLTSKQTTSCRLSCLGIEDSKFSEGRISSIPLSQNNELLSNKKPTGNYDSDEEGDYAGLPEDPFM